MSPEQPRRLAEKLERDPRPGPAQLPEAYVHSLVTHELAKVLRELADEDET